jgi:hypothetical protein
MAAAKKKTSSPSGGTWLRGVFSWLFGSGQGVLIVVVVLGLLVGGTGFAWWKLKDRILAENRINPAQVEVTPQPDWIRQSNVRAEIFLDPTIDGPLSLEDDDLAERIASAFARHPWVAKVLRVAKQPGSVKVDLAYRRPVCMVQAPGGGHQPVDASGVLLPSADFTHLDVRHYPILLYVDSDPTVPPGTRWGDTRVVGGAEIAGLLVDVWEKMHLDCIEPWAAYPTTAGQPAVDAVATPTRLSGQSIEPFFTLVTRNKTRIAWGRAPGVNTLGEPKAEEKVAWLKHYFSTHDDSLDGPEGKPQELDVRKPLPSMQP